ncbi:D-alanine--D-alanine ligase A [Candidatus Saccharibacteria bacterium]|nr:MAG: D-alanine--D-alanine ligase A [Candidatus Saccharibacteria bacterium]
MSRQTILLLFGGESSEHDVSLKSACNVYAALDGQKYDVLLGYIDKSGKWWLVESLQNDMEDHGGSQLLAALGLGSFLTLPGNKVVHPDVIFPVLHGANGEDGTVQGLAELLHVPIVGCDTTSSAVCMDKVMTKQIAKSIGVATADWLLINKGESLPSYQQVQDQLGSILFVKPARSGSSVGVSRVTNQAEFVSAVDQAFLHGRRVVIEQEIVGREIETAVLGNPPDHKVSGVGEIIAGNDFYDYEDKYAIDSQSQTIDQADLDEDLSEKIRQTSIQIYSALGCSGLARIDYILKDDRPYLIEVNTLPGFTNISMYPKLWRVEGLRYSDLVDELIDMATKK